MKSFQLKKGVFTLENDKLVWVKQEGRYVLKVEHNVLTQRGSCSYIGAEDPTDKTLPKLPDSLDITLDALKIHYERIGNYCVIYDPSVEEWVDYTAPLDRVDEHGNVVEKCQQQFTSKIPSERMLEAAKKYFGDAIIKINDYEKRQFKEEFDDYFSEWSEDEFSLYFAPSDFDAKMIPYLEDKYYFSEVLYNSWIVILKPAIKGKTSITLKVPRRHVGAAIGRGGEKVKTLRQDLGLRYVEILPDYEN